MYSTTTQRVSESHLWDDASYAEESMLATCQSSASINWRTPSGCKEATVSPLLSRETLSSLANEQHLHPCTLCGKIYKRKDSLKRHQTYECGKPPQFQCPFCIMKCHQKFNVVAHVRARHGHRDFSSAEWFTWPGGSQAAPVDKKGPFTCPVCLRIYRRSRSLWRHQRYECSTEWRSWPGASLSSELDKDGPFPCPACQRIYRRRRSLWRHQRYECNKPAQFHCPFCSYSAKQKCSVKLHVSKKHSIPDENAFRINYIQDSLDDM
ncbi:oocyte zinc finger protein XlCOF26-like [Schistocerca americana]|uniref:oocyte zinc finger protein XlCOF26-like n=1 Tax=Schistocerca americana TaxID=7009 RepID=UPI001F4F98A1|nr:oocyte zinc finger protein XlCOF26-like [Schistocerca americana]